MGYLTVSRCKQLQMINFFFLLYQYNTESDHYKVVMLITSNITENQFLILIITLRVNMHDVKTTIIFNTKLGRWDLLSW